jgi:hypothetical protein
MMSIAVAVTVFGASGRLSGEPSPTTSMARAPRASTSTTVGFGNYPGDDSNPLQLYPGRPGAKYEDIEARPKAPVSNGFVQVRVLGWSVVPHAALPAGSAPADLGPYSKAGLVDGYVPVTTRDPGDLLRVVVRETLFSDMTHCVATAASDGTVLVPYAKPRRRSRATTTSTLFDDRPRDSAYFLPLGTRRGRLYFTCDVPAILSEFRVVWGLDV